MLELVACAACGCFVKDTERACPFCGAAVAMAPASPPVARVSRAAWLALGSSVVTAAVAAIMACSSDGGTAPAMATFPCGDNRCVQATDFCSTEGHNYSCSATIVTVSAVCAPLADGGALYPPECVNDPHCACITARWLAADAAVATDDAGAYTWKKTCTEVDGGGVRLEVDDFTCAPCYGSPPARIERLLVGRALA